MIKKIHIEQVATIKDLTMEPLQINYIFGGNGSGKTTLSKYINSPDDYTGCSIERDDDCEVVVYNQDFIKKNFQDKNAINGIFTIGESAVETQNDIERYEKEKAQHLECKKQYEKSLEAQQTKIDEAYEKFKQDCWEIQKNLSADIPYILSGARSKKEEFARRCSDKFTGKRSLYQYEKIVETYNQIYQKNVQSYSIIPLYSFCESANSQQMEICAIEDDSIFQEKIVKSNDSNFARFIQEIGNLDWVGQGIRYIRSDKICPFCQRTLDKQIIDNLNRLFDETYQTALKHIDCLYNAYQSIGAGFASYLKSTMEQLAMIPFIDSAKLQDYGTNVQDIIAKNITSIEKKLAHPSESYNMIKSHDVIKGFNEELDKINAIIEQNNALERNIKDARAKLTEQAWDFIANQNLYDTIEKYNKEREGLNRGILKIKMSIDSQAQKISEIEQTIKDLRKKVVSIDNAVEEINSLLQGFGFKGFHIEKKDELSYKLVRPDGSEVHETLSEGEHRFITFLYYYQLVKGTLNKDSINKDKILVIDDPISSLDSNILFIVSFLVRGLIRECLDGGKVKQIFVLTHNIYFHQEIVFKGNRDNPSPKKERFWVLRKVDEKTEVTGYEQNQINSSYELLWKEFKNPHTDGVLICNTMRRILEHYFNVIGHKDYEKIINQFNGQDKIICRTLLPFINSGSHTINDDLHLSIDADMIDRYKEIFKMIFINTNQESHYNMMMGLE